MPFKFNIDKFSQEPKVDEYSTPSADETSEVTDLLNTDFTSKDLDFTLDLSGGASSITTDLNTTGTTEEKKSEVLGEMTKNLPSPFDVISSSMSPEEAKKASFEINNTKSQTKQLYSDYLGSRVNYAPVNLEGKLPESPLSAFGGVSKVAASIDISRADSPEEMAKTFQKHYPDYEVKTVPGLYNNKANLLMYKGPKEESWQVWGTSLASDLAAEAPNLAVQTAASVASGGLGYFARVGIVGATSAATEAADQKINVLRGLREGVDKSKVALEGMFGIAGETIDSLARVGRNFKNLGFSDAFRSGFSSNKVFNDTQELQDIRNLARQQNEFAESKGMAPLLPGQVAVGGLLKTQEAQMTSVSPALQAYKGRQMIDVVDALDKDIKDLGGLGNVETALSDPKVGGLYKELKDNIKYSILGRDSKLREAGEVVNTAFNRYEGIEKAQWKSLYNQADEAFAKSNIKVDFTPLKEQANSILGEADYKILQEKLPDETAVSRVIKEDLNTGLTKSMSETTKTKDAYTGKPVKSETITAVAAEDMQGFKDVAKTIRINAPDEVSSVIKGREKLKQPTLKSLLEDVSNIQTVYESGGSEGAFKVMENIIQESNAILGPAYASGDKSTIKFASGLKSAVQDFMSNPKFVAPEGSEQLLGSLDSKEAREGVYKYLEANKRFSEFQQLRDVKGVKEAFENNVEGNEGNFIADFINSKNYRLVSVLPDILQPEEMAVFKQGMKEHLYQNAKTPNDLEKLYDTYSVKELNNIIPPQELAEVENAVRSRAILDNSVIAKYSEGAPVNAVQRGRGFVEAAIAKEGRGLEDIISLASMTNNNELKNAVNISILDYVLSGSRGKLTTASKEKMSEYATKSGVTELERKVGINPAKLQENINKVLEVRGTNGRLIVKDFLGEDKVKELEGYANYVSRLKDVNDAGTSLIVSALGADLMNVSKILTEPVKVAKELGRYEALKAMGNRYAKSGSQFIYGENPKNIDLAQGALNFKIPFDAENKKFYIPSTLVAQAAMDFKQERDGIQKLINSNTLSKEQEAFAKDILSNTSVFSGLQSTQEKATTQRKSLTDTIKGVQKSRDEDLYKLIKGQ